MKILVANLGSTSFKYKLFDMQAEQENLIASGGYERVTDYGQAIDQCLETLLSEGHLSAVDDLDAVGFKTVLGKDLSGCVADDDAVLEALRGFEEIAPAHNPPYALGIQTFRQKIPGATRVALFETAFYQWVPESAARYAVPKAWYEEGVRRYGFHGASHKYIAERSAEWFDREDVAERARRLYVDGPGAFDGPPLRVISCHLGGSSSVTGILNGVAIGTSMGLSPQSGLPQNNRVGDLDAAAVPYVMKTLGLDLEEVERQMTKESGLLGLSGVSGDIRDIEAAAEEGNDNARLALEVFVREIRRYIGAYYVELGGLDALVFTAGIGENNPMIRASVCHELEHLGIRLDLDKNFNPTEKETDISQDHSAVRVLVLPTNEELIVARETRRRLTA